MKKYKLKFKTGFTLIELLVALGVFMVVMTITLSAFINIMDIQNKTESFRKVNDNLNFAMEAMMREIREGKNYCQECMEGTISFTNKDETKTIEYKLNTEEYIIERKENSGGWIRMTSEGVKITRLSFSVSGEETYPGDKQQPLVTISIGGESGEKEKLKSRLDLQATVSQRKLDSR